MGFGRFLFGFGWRLVALAFVFYMAAIPLALFVTRAHEGLYEEPLFHAAALCSALLVFPALIFLSWWDTATGSIVPLFMLAVMLAAHERTDPDFVRMPSAGKLLEGRVALVAGAGRGIGLAVAKEYLRQGGRVAVTGRGEPETALTQSKGFLGSIALDLADLRGSVATFPARLKQKFPDVTFDILVLNGGIGCGKDVPSQDGLEDVAQINFVANVRVAQALLPQLAANATILFSSSASSRNWKLPFERLTNLSDTLTDVGYPLNCLQRYARSKALVDAFAIQWAKTLTKQQVYTIFPNPTHTDMLEDALEDLARTLRYPSFFAPGTPLFDAFLQFWLKALARHVDRVALQYDFGAWSGNELERNGCSFFEDKCLTPMPYEEKLLPQILQLAR